MTTTIAIGDSDLTIQTCNHLGQPAVMFSGSADVILTFPTIDQALKVARALCSIPEPKEAN